MGCSRLRVWWSVGFVALSLCAWSSIGRAIPLDSEGDIKLGARMYVNARIGTEDTHNGVIATSPAKDPPVVSASSSATFPYSPAGHLRQNRGFIEVELNHSLDRLVRNGVGPFSLLNDLPFKIKGLAYNFTFRGEGDSLYDWGPQEYSTAKQFYDLQKAKPPLGVVPRMTYIDVAHAREKLRHLGTDRERLFQAFVEGNVGNLFVRIGRQNLSWGETDAFQLLDHINPLDSSFGGFLVSLDERRVPLDMAVANYYLGDFGPFSEMHLEGFGAFDNNVGYYPGTPAGSPWAPPSLGAASNTTGAYALRPANTVQNARGGFQLKFNALDATFGIAHYYTYFDLPGAQVFTNGPTIVPGFNDGLACPDPKNPGQTNPNNRTCGYLAHFMETAPKVQVSGVSTTFAVPQIYGVVRSELAYFKDEPAYSQGQLDPFIFNANHESTGGTRTRDSINAVVGFDSNQWIRFLNPNQTFLISTQFFYKHIKNAAGSTVLDKNGFPNADREVLPVYLNEVSYGVRTLGQVLEPIFITQPADQYLQTLFIGTSYRSGTINPSMIFFYDWGGAMLYQPAIQFSRDPFRFSIDYSIIDAHMYKGGSTISLGKDRDNVQFRIEYVI
jgi:hypothetical protein